MRTRGPSSKVPRRGRCRTWSCGVAIALLAVGCGQFGGVHGRSGSATLRESRVAARASASPLGPSGPGAPVLSSPNGETTGRASTLAYQRITVTTKVAGVPLSDGPLFVCPVQGEGSYSDDFGAPRYAGGYHPHQGNDIFANVGTPVVAPFDGSAVATPNYLGGLAVKVHGSQGYVYNAHLSAYGTLGDVRTGQVIGYVGNTGDASGGPPHDQFEWHPGNGPAVDPFPYLTEAC